VLILVLGLSQETRSARQSRSARLPQETHSAYLLPGKADQSQCSGAAGAPKSALKRSLTEAWQDGKPVAAEDRSVRIISPGTASVPSMKVDDSGASKKEEYENFEGNPQYTE